MVVLFSLLTVLAEGFSHRPAGPHPGDPHLDLKAALSSEFLGVV